MTKDVRSFIRLRNTQNLLDILLKRGALARVELSEITGLTKTTISSITKELISKGIVEETVPVLNKNKVGRTIIPLRIKENAACTIGIDLSRHHLNAVLMNTQGEIILKKKGPSYGDIGPQKVIDNLFKVINDLLHSFSKKNKIDAIGIGMPGPLDREKGIAIEPPKFFGWQNIPLGDMVSERYDLPVWVENDANCAALAEKWYGKGKNINSFLYILLNEGIGAGIFLNGKIYRSSSNYEGEMGHIVLRKDEDPIFLENFPKYEKLLKFIKNKNKFSEAEKKLTNEVGYIIGESLASLSNILDPEKIFIGGELTILKEKILIPIEKMFQKYTLAGKWGAPIPIELSKNYENAISVGAATYAMRQFIIRKAAKI